LIVHQSALTNVSVVQDVGQKMLMITLKKKESLLLQNIHTLPDKLLVKLLKVNTKSKATIWSKPEILLNYKLILTSHQFQSVLMLAIGSHIQEVSSKTAELN